MSRETLQARAIHRAFEERVRIFALPGRPNCYVTKSQANPTERYYLVVGPGGIVGCSCRAFEYRQSCKHAEALKSRLARRASDRRHESWSGTQRIEIEVHRRLMRKAVVDAVASARKDARRFIDQILADRASSAAELSDGVVSLRQVV